MYDLGKPPIDIHLKIENILQLLRGLQINYTMPEGTVVIHPPLSGILITHKEIIEIEKMAQSRQFDSLLFYMKGVINRIHHGED